MIEAVGEAVLENLSNSCAGLHLLRSETVHLGVTSIANDELLLRIEHGKALQHVVQRSVELLVLCPQILLALLQGSALALALLRRLPAAPPGADWAHLRGR